MALAFLNVIYLWFCNKRKLRDQHVALTFHYIQPASQRTMVQQTSKA